MERRRQIIEGVVVSDKMSKTRVIELKRNYFNALYRKNLTRKSRLFIHDEKNESKTGDLVQAVYVRPLSRHKSFQLKKVLQTRVAE